MSEIQNLAEMVETISRKHKKKEALHFEGKLVTYREMDENANKVANALSDLGIKKGDRVAMMLPNIPEFVYTFFGIQKLGAVAVPFNTMYKGREITHILNDSKARAIVALSNFANLINEVREDAPALEHVILTGQRTLVLVTPESTVNVQMVVERTNFESPDQAFQVVGELLVEVLQSFGVQAWYKHRGGVRVGGKKIATVLVSEMENLIVVNSIIFLGAFAAEELFRVIWVSPEIKDKVVEPSTSVEQETGSKPDIEAFTEALLKALSKQIGVDTKPGTLKRDELFGYEKAVSLAGT
jgi:long-chain acyl-CoA synthetase